MRIPSPSRGYTALRRGRASLAGQSYHVTTATAFRRRLFANFDAASAAAATFRHSSSAGGASLIAWTLMPDHAHWLLELGEGATLADVVGRLKANSARAVNAACGCEGQQVWAPGYHDHAIRRDESLLNVAAYIVANPVRARMVESPRDYPFWDACWLVPGSDWMP